MSLVKEGWIEKKGQTFMAGYKRRWLVLYSDKTLKYYEDNYYEILKGSIDISEASKVQNSMEHSKNWKFGWEIVTPTRNWYFSSKTDNDRKQWIQNIQTVMEFTSLKSPSGRLSYNKHKRLKNIAKEQNKKKHIDNLNSSLQRGQSKTVTTPLITHDNKQNDINEDDDDVFGAKERTKSLDIDHQLNIAKDNMQNNSKSINSNKKSDEYIPGLYSSSFGKHNKSQATSPNGNETVSKFGKDYIRMTESTMTQMMNKHVNLSLKHKQTQSEKKEEEEGEDEKSDINLKFQWEQYDAKMHELIKKDENIKDDMDNQDELKCFCGGNIKKVICDQNSRVITCEFCGQHKISDGAQYFECDQGEINEEYHDKNGWRICSYCCYNELIMKYYNPALSNKPRRIGISVMIERISNINIEDQSFRGKILITHCWKPTKEEVQLFRDKPTNFQPFWIPNFEFPDCIQIHDMGLKQSHWNTDYIILRKGESNGLEISPLPYIISGQYWIDATFSEVFELENFPVDCQDLTIKIQSQQYTQICVFDTPFQGQNMLTMSQEYSTIPEWMIHEPKFEIIKKKIGPITQYSQINLSIKLQRIPKAYFWRMLLFLILLTAMSLISFSIDILISGADRISFLIVLLLTAVAYQFAISNDLPTVSYLTLMDKYILQTFFFIFAMLIETAIALKFELETLDLYCNYIFWSIFAIVQILFLIYTIKVKQYEVGKLKHAASDMNKYGNKKRNTNKMIKMHKFGTRKL